MMELEAEREQRQRDYDKKLLLAKSKIENVQVRNTRKKHPGETGLTNLKKQDTEMQKMFEDTFRIKLYL